MQSKISEVVKEKALMYVGQKEISGNLGFTDESFNSLMNEVGFKKGHAWCAYFAELVWKNAFKTTGALEKVKELDALFSASALATWNNFKACGKYEMSKKPSVGAVAIWQYYKNGLQTTQGHAGIVVEIHASDFITIEGNTNSMGGREGIEVAGKKRLYEFNPKREGLVLKGFIHLNIQ